MLNCFFELRLSAISHCYLTVLGNFEEALVVLRKALDIQRKTIGPHLETVITSQEIEKVLEKLGRKNEAKEASRFSEKLKADQKRIEKAMEELEI